jgi:hypothetical protein
MDPFSRHNASERAKVEKAARDMAAGATPEQRDRRMAEAAAARKPQPEPRHPWPKRFYES